MNREDALEGNSGSFYLASMRAHKLLVAAVVLATVFAAAAWLTLRSPTYEASARMLIAPLPQDDTTFLGLQMLRDSGDPTRTAQTAATLAETPAAARLAATAMGEGWTVDRVLNAVNIQPEGQSNILDVTASAEDPDEAAKLANIYVKAVVEARDRALHAEVKEELKSNEARLSEVSQSSPTASTLAGRINRLNGLLETGDPTLTPSAPALPPSSPTGASAVIVIPLALIAGLVLGGGTAVLFDLANRSVRDEAELIRLYPLPVLTRVPRVRRLAQRTSGKPPPLVVPEVREAFRTIVAQLETSHDSDRTLMVASPSTGDGKTTTSVSLASALASAGHSVVLLDLDLRRSDLAPMANVSTSIPARELLERVDQGRSIGDLLADGALPLLKVLIIDAGPDGETYIDAVNHRLEALLKAIGSQAEYIVVDTAPLGEVSDALRLAQLADSVILVARLGNTRRRNIEITRDLLERTGCAPSGYVLIGANQGSTGSYYH